MPPETVETTETEETVDTTETPETTETVETTEAPETTETTEETTETTEAEPEYVTKLRAEYDAKIAELEGRIQPKGQEQDKKEAPAPQRERTPQEWTDIEKTWGFHTSKSKKEDGSEETVLNINPRQFCERMNAFGNTIFAEVEKMIHGSTVDMRLETALSDMAKKEPDIRQYSDAIKEYLNQRYLPKDQSNQKFIQDALWWAKGRGMKNVLKKAEDKRIQNRKIVVPASPNKGGKPGAPTVLSARQKADAQRLGMSEKEYIQSMKMDLSKL